MLKKKLRFRETKYLLKMTKQGGFEVWHEKF